MNATPIFFEVLKNPPRMVKYIIYQFKVLKNKKGDQA